MTCRGSLGFQPTEVQSSVSGLWTSSVQSGNEKYDWASWIDIVSEIATGEVRFVNLFMAFISGVL